MTTPPQEPQEPQGDQAHPESEPAPQSAPAQPPYAQPGYGQPAYGQQHPQPGYDQHYAQQPGQPQYAQQQYYGQPAYPAGPRPGTEKNWMGITSLVLSLAGLITGISAIAGIVFGHLGLSAAKRGEADNRGVALGGLITGYVIVGLGILATIFVLVFFGAVFGAVADECLGSDPASWCTEG